MNLFSLLTKKKPQQKVELIDGIEFKFRKNSLSKSLRITLKDKNSPCPTFCGHTDRAQRVECIPWFVGISPCALLSRNDRAMVGQGDLEILKQRFLVAGLRCNGILPALVAHGNIGVVAAQHDL